MSLATPDAPIDTCWRTIGTRGDRTCPRLLEHVRCENCPVHHDTAQALLARLPVHQDDLPTDDGVAPAQGGTRFNVLSFRLQGEWLAMPTRVLDEVAELRPVRAVPHRRRGALLGLVNVRGVLTPCVSLARVLSLPAAGSFATEPGHRGRLLIVKDGARQIALPVDAVDGIHPVPDDGVRPPPATLSAASQGLSMGVIDIGDHRMGLLDPVRLLAALAGGIA
jgi:chemotaxis signal transduction protein